MLEYKIIEMKIKIKFTDFWPGFDDYHNSFIEVLERKYDVEISDEPDYLIFSIFGYDHLAYELSLIHI